MLSAYRINSSFSYSWEMLDLAPQTPECHRIAHPDPECCNRSALWEELQLVGRVAVGDTNSLLFVSSKSCCCPSLGLGGPAGLDPVCACFLWGGRDWSGVLPHVSNHRGDILFLPKSCGLIWISAAFSCFSVT